MKKPKNNTFLHRDSAAFPVIFLIDELGQYLLIICTDLGLYVPLDHHFKIVRFIIAGKKKNYQEKLSRRLG